MNEIIEMEPKQSEVSVTGSGSAVGYADMLRYALDSGADLDRLEKLMAMQERDNANKARMAFVAAMVEFKKSAPEIYKDKNVSFTGTSYNHATLGGICDAVIALLAKHGISHDWDTLQKENGMIKVTCILTHIFGHSKSTSLESPPDNSGKKNAIQQIASTVTYLQRYTLLGATGLATKDMPDDDGRGYVEPKVKEKMTINGARFDGALAAIKAGTYTAAQVRANFLLSTDQETALDDAVKELA